jgi:16S rRNA (cytosine967-C5)-methyltransferase
MTPGARVAAAIGVLDAWRGGQPAEQALTRWARGARYAGSKDRAAVRDHVYDVLRRCGLARRWAAARTVGRCCSGCCGCRGRRRTALHRRGPRARAARGGADAVSAPAGMRRTRRRMCPDWLRPAIASGPGDEERAALFAALCARAPVWLRVARRRGTVRRRGGAGARRDRDRPRRTCDTALRITEGARRLRQRAAYAGGRVELQDLSAQRAVASVDWPAEGRILDYCAGGGGKALAIADRTDAGLRP